MVGMFSIQILYTERMIKDAKTLLTMQIVIKNNKKVKTVKNSMTKIRLKIWLKIQKDKLKKEEISAEEEHQILTKTLRILTIEIKCLTRNYKGTLENTQQK